MNAQQQAEIDALEAHFENVDLAEWEPGGALHFDAEAVKEQPAVVLGKLCGVYHKIRPFLDWASRFFLVPKKAKAAIKAFMALNDVVCPN